MESNTTDNNNDNTMYEDNHKENKQTNRIGMTITTILQIVIPVSITTTMIMVNSEQHGDPQTMTKSSESQQAEWGSQWEHVQDTKGYQ